MKSNFLCLLFFSFVLLLFIESTSASSACLLEFDVGLCRGAFPKYYFDHKENKCKQFSWGGCQGTVPFDTLKECEEAECPTQPCVLKPDAGPCEAAIKKWFYDKKAGACRPFTWGGCGGVVPFNSKRECIRSQCNPGCSQKPEAGPCKFEKVRWYYNNRYKSCWPFIWGGCGGKVPFKSFYECARARCLPRRITKPSPVPSPSTSPSSVPTVSKCQLKDSDVLPPSNPGEVTCLAFWTSWYFDKTSNTCKSFSYSGCSNVGPFTTETECQKECI